MIGPKEKIELQKHLPYGYSNDVLKVLEDNGVKMPKGGDVKNSDILKTLNGRENIEIEDAIYEVHKKNKAAHDQIVAKRKEILESKKPEGVTSGS